MIGVRIIFKSSEYLYKETQELGVSYHKIMVNTELRPESSSEGVLGKTLPVERHWSRRAQLCLPKQDLAVKPTNNPL